jgi:hypothetical protein
MSRTSNNGLDSRIYVIATADGASETMVRANHPNAAWRHVCGTQFTTRVATQRDLERLFGEGKQVIDLTKPAPTQQLSLVDSVPANS